MKKLLLVLLVVALASFLFVGCTPTVPDEDDDGDDGDVVVSEVTVAIADSVKIGNYTYVSDGDHDITVTFPAPVAGIVTANITGCTGDYSKAVVKVDSAVVLFPDATKKIWTGSGTFTASASDCCASYVEVDSGECAAIVCIAFPVIVDGDDPYSTVEVSSEACDCDGCAVTFESFYEEEICEDILECGDDCSGLASWSFDLYDSDPFDVCCLVPCIEPVYTCSGVDCPILCTTSCIGLTAAQITADPFATVTYYVVETLADEVGNTVRYYATITLDSACVVTVQEYPEDNDEGCATFETPSTTINHIVLAEE